MESCENPIRRALFVGKGSDAGPPQTGFARQLPLRNYVGKGSDAYQPIYRDIKEKSVYIDLISVGSGLVSDLNHRIYRLNGPSSRKA
ncbi:MAG: hypothetical protein CL932_06495 [Deltaproteobacteria bacterium]|nr:hypothetical protein [Deltaproteobacteria bacterium]